MYSAWLELDGESFAVNTVVVRANDHDPGRFEGASPELHEAELSSLADILAADLDRFSIPAEIVQHVVREALESNLLGDRPELWSPLASATRHADYGRWKADEDIAADLHEEWLRQHEELPAANVSFTFGTVDPDGHVVVSLDIGDRRVAAFAFDGGGFVVAFPAAVEGIGITIVDDAADERLWSRLAAEIPSGEPDTVILWRLYTGQNSWVRDVVTSARDGAHRLVLGGLRGPGLLVGRALRVMSRSLGKVRKDPLRQRRLSAAEIRDHQASDACPRLADAPAGIGRAVVVVHGTMSTAVPLARAVFDTVGTTQRCLRYEHDTWLSLDANASELAELIRERVEEQVVLVAHSRGGLIAARAAQMLGGSGGVEVAHLLTLGSPFAGTPVALAARGPSFANAAVMGGLRYLGGPVVDAATRIGGLLLRVDPPPGLLLMYPNNDVLPLLRQFLPRSTTMVAGTADERSDRYGPAFVGGVGDGAFGDERNDLVVAVASAQMPSAQCLTVPCDHFSFLEEPEVVAAIRDAADRLKRPSGHDPVGGLTRL